MLDEIESAVRKHPHISSVLFHDDSFMALPRDVLREFGEEYKRRVDIPFCVFGVIPNYVLEEKFDILCRAGMNRVRMGIQSGSARILDFYKRPSPPEKVRRAAAVVLGLLNGPLHVARRHELTLLDVHRTTRCRTGGEQVGLPTQERRDLQAVDDLGGELRLAGLVHVTDDGHTGLVLHAREDAQTLVETRAAIRMAARAVRLVVGCLEHDGHAVSLGHSLHGDRTRVSLERLDHVEAGDQNERSPVANDDVTDSHRPSPSSAALDSAKHPS